MLSTGAAPRRALSADVLWLTYTYNMEAWTREIMSSRSRRPGSTRAAHERALCSVSTL